MKLQVFSQFATTGLLAAIASWVLFTSMSPGVNTIALFAGAIAFGIATGLIASSILSGPITTTQSPLLRMTMTLSVIVIQIVVAWLAAPIAHQVLA
jgi:hypothetical protein